MNNYRPEYDYILYMTKLHANELICTINKKMAVHDTQCNDYLNLST